MGNAISTLLSLGNDAMNNMYDVYYTPDGSAEPFQLSGRLLSFEPPQWTVGTHDISYHGHTLKMPSTKIDFERKLTLKFRLDANYEYYKYWRDLAKYAGNPVTGGVANAPINTGKLIVLTVSDNMVGAGGNAPAIYGNPLKDGEVKPNDDPIKIINSHQGLAWIYENCWVADTTEPAFTTDGGDIQEFEAHLYFGHCWYPHSESDHYEGPSKSGGNGK